jgi:hypothetical protein
MFSMKRATATINGTMRSRDRGIGGPWRAGEGNEGGEQ